MTKTHSTELNIAIQASLSAANITTQVYNSLVDGAAKAGREPVTIADYASQAVINRALRAAFASDSILAEEHASDFYKVLSSDQRQQVANYVNVEAHEQYDEQGIANLLDAPAGDPTRQWIVDPIDGTKGFIAKRAYAIAISLLDAEGLRIGVLACPNLSIENPGELGGEGVVFFAERDRGAFYRLMNSDIDVPMRVSGATPTDPLHLLTSFEKKHSNQDLFSRVVAAMPSPEIQSTGLDGQGKYGLVANGGASCYFRLVPDPDFREKVWDHAAGAIIVQEAGGTVTDFNGQPLDFRSGTKMQSNRGVVASNGRIHKALLEAIRQAET